jgi:hypothetical protein
MLLDRDGLIVALRSLDNELAAAGVRGEVFVVGGAAMALAYDARRATGDGRRSTSTPSSCRRRKCGTRQRGLPNVWTLRRIG